MTKRINLNFIFVIAAAIILSVSFSTIVSYRLFQKEVFADLASFAGLLEEMDVLDKMKKEGVVQPEDELRITWIAEDGVVIYDSYTRGDVLENHKDRLEIIKAMQAGEGTSIRKSQTMGRNIFFYAKKTADGTIIRIAKEAESIWSVYKNMLPVTLICAFCSFFISVFIARRLTKVLIRPIEQMAEDMEHLENVTVYGELAPFVEKIRFQHEEVLKNARIRQEFTANVSHELKTPLTSISGYAELIASGMASKKEGRHFAREIYGNAQRLLAMINDILKLSELEDSDEDRLSLERADLFALADDCIKMIKPMADKYDVCVSLKGTPLFVYGDKSLLEELIYNLCDNAIRYNKKGGHVWVTVTDKLIVQDDGIGIPKKCQKQVFERFFRVDKSRSKKTGGTGLGLAIVKHIAQVHNADISLDSDEGFGTTICVKFSENPPLA
ncbi:MAG: ATP-binding protein [Lachnospiraceae bacterium]|nr:ATP-binding protein [Lachnospiraceae bacterium]